VDKDVENMFGGDLTASLHKDIFSKGNICTVNYTNKFNLLLFLCANFLFIKFIAYKKPCAVGYLALFARNITVKIGISWSLVQESCATIGFAALHLSCRDKFATINRL
jgi:hypothetical protein